MYFIKMPEKSANKKSLGKRRKPTGEKWENKRDRNIEWTGHRYIKNSLFFRQNDGFSGKAFPTQILSAAATEG